MGCYVREMQLMLTSTVQTNILDPDKTAPRRTGSTLIATKKAFSNEQVDDIMGRHIRKMQLMLTPMAYFSVQTNIVDLILGEQFNLVPHCLL